MFRNYFKIAWRNLFKNKGFSAINIVGLASGMAVSILIGMWIWDELSFDNYHEHYDTIAQVMTTQTFNNEITTEKAVAMPLGNELRTKYGSDFKTVSMATWNYTHVIRVGDKMISTKGMWVEATFPSMFTLKAVEGSVTQGFDDPSAILISQSVAKALFGDDKALHKVIRVNNRDDYKVTGVYEDLPRNSTLTETKILLPWSKYITTAKWLQDALTEWGNHSFQAFVQVDHHVDFAKETQKIKNASMVHLNEAEDGKEQLVLQPMKNWRLYNEFKEGKVAGGRIKFVWLFGIIGVFVLLLACINFMNLSTARSEKRAKEVGIRKTVGSLRNQLIKQFLTESVLITFLSLVLAIALSILALPFFNSIADKQMSLPYNNVAFWGMIIGFTLFTGIISGSYPAFYLSGFQPIKVLKGTFRVGKNAALPRKVMVVIQFTISVALIIGTLIVYQQIQYAKNRPVGYSREGLITVDMNTPDLRDHYDALRNELISSGVVANAAKSSSPTTNVFSNQIGFNWQGKDPNSLPIFGTIGVTKEFGSTIDWKVKEGRDFSVDFADSTSMILNEAAVKLTGLKDIVGKTIQWGEQNFTVVGVIKDMVMESPYDPIKPTIFVFDPGWASVITVRIKPGVAVKDALAKIESVFKKYNPASSFDYRFNDTEYATKFSDEERIGNLATFFAVLAIFISCLGLFGLASFVAEQRNKEISVRKVLGATLFNLWRMLSKEFVILVVIACAIAIPLAWYFLHSWLQGYNYRVHISWWVFVVAACGALVITLATVSYQAIKAALANPVKNLRSE